MPLKFDFSNVFYPNIENGIKEEEVNEYKETIKDFVLELFENPPGYMKIFNNQKLLDSVLDLKDWVQSFDNFVVLGIGGSALGNIALQMTLNPLNYNLLPKDKRKYPRIFVLDNVDPNFIASVLDTIDVKNTLFNVISKSGTTAEAMANYKIARGLIESFGLDPKNHLVFTTDPEKGILRKIGLEENIKMLEIPQDVGGRFSVLTPVGLLSALAGGIDIKELWNSAKESLEKLKETDIWKNPATLNAVIHYIYYKKGYNISVMMPYSNQLYYLADWYRQLWAESLGKKFDLKGNTVYVGQTPVKALGTTDQHSQVQLYNEGPKDKIVTLIRVENFEREIVIPKVHDEIKELNYLSGKRLSELLNTELEGTKYALTVNGCPNLEISFPKIDEYHVAQFFILYEFQTSIAGKLFNINPYDQPGVELGKKMTYALMGREGYEDLKESVSNISKKIIRIQL